MYLNESRAVQNIQPVNKVYRLVYGCMGRDCPDHDADTGSVPVVCDAMYCTRWGQQLTLAVWVLRAWPPRWLALELAAMEHAMQRLHLNRVVNLCACSVGLDTSCISRIEACIQLDARDQSLTVALLRTRPESLAEHLISPVVALQEGWLTFWRGVAV